MTQLANLDHLLQACLRSTAPVHRQSLVDHALNSPEALRAFGITAETVEYAVDRRLRLLRKIHPDLNQFCHQALGWPYSPLDVAWTLWLPLAQWIDEQQRRLNRPFVQGILGGQGTGKTTLATILSRILMQLGQQVCCLSIDDFYKSYSERQLLQTADPRLVWRGPPGTHDVNLAIVTLQQLRAGQATAVPQFDKSARDGQGDRVASKRVVGATVVLFEGWLVGVKPIDPEQFSPERLDALPWPINTEADCAFARDSNERLRAYMPLWNQLDRLLVLSPIDYRLSQQWRRDAERAMTAAGRSGMSDQDIERFVVYFWRSLHPELFIAPLLHDDSPMPAASDRQHVDVAIQIDMHHRPHRIYTPSASTA